MAFVTDSCGQALLFLSGVCCPSIIPTGVNEQRATTELLSKVGAPVIGTFLMPW